MRHVSAFFRYLFVGLALLGAWQADAETLVVLGDESYPPVIYLRDGVPSGVLPAVLAKAEKLTGDHYEVHLSPWKRAYEMALRGEGAVIGVSFTEERARLFDYSKSIYNDDIQLVTLKDKAFAYATLEDLRGKLIGGVNGASYGDEVDKAIAAGLFTVERDVSQVGRLRKLLSGRLDAAFIGNGMPGYNALLASNAELQRDRGRLAVLPVPLTRDPLHLAFAKSMNQRAALERFDAALAKLRKSGELNRVIEAAMKP